MRNRLSELREVVFLILFRADFYSREEMQAQIKDFFDGEDAFKKAEKEKVAAKVLNIAEHLDEIDEYLDLISEGWKTKRMAKTDLTALRLAYYEMKYDESVPAAVAINEAVELAKTYGLDTSPSFVNGILSKAVKQLEGCPQTEAEE